MTNENNTKKSSVQLTPRTKEALKKLGTKGQTYDDVVCNLIAQIDPELGKNCECMNDDNQIHEFANKLKKLKNDS